MKLMDEFKNFLFKQNALALATGVVVGGAVSKLVAGIVDDLLMPLLSLVLPTGDWRSAQWVISGTNAVKYGDLLGRALDFLIISGVVFLLVRLVLRENKPAPAPTRTCPQCLEIIPAAAIRCRACGEATSATRPAA